MITVFKMVGKHCTRCKGGIYTAWRTQDDKKFYHPHCFTCAICGLILESVNECGDPNLQEIYCRDCYVQYLSKLKTRENNFSNANEAEAFVLRHLANDISLESQSKVVTPNQNKACPTTGISSEMAVYSGDATNAMEHSRSSMSSINRNMLTTRAQHHDHELLRNSTDLTTLMDNSPSHDCQLSNNYVNSNISRNMLQRTKSRIPRPTSAQSKNSINNALQVGKNTTGGMLSFPNSKTEAMRTCKDATNCVRPATPKMHRSVSMQQRSNKDATIATYSASSKSLKTIPPRPKSANLEQNVGCRPKGYIYNPNGCKRQCAAAFNVNKDPGHASTLNTTAQLTGNEQPRKSGIPSRQDIMSVIKREHSTVLTKSQMWKHQTNALIKDGNANANNNTNTNRGVVSRSFKITFECPICIGSLVQGSNRDRTELKEGRPGGNVVTICGHLFHRECMENWLKIKGNKRCPICSSLCLPESLQPVYLECNVSAEAGVVSKSFPERTKNDLCDELITAYKTLKAEHDLLKAKYGKIIAENESSTLKAAIASSLQSAYDMECRNRLQLQWENKKLMRQIEDLRLKPRMR